MSGHVGHETEPAAKVAFLLRRAFPLPPQAIETHMSWVFLTPDRAYKLKKPVENPFFDHRSIEARRADCEAEVELNRDLAPGVYLGTLPLTSYRDGELGLDGSGEVVDWLVVMRRLPVDSMLDRRLAAGAGPILPAEVEALARHLASFYASAAAAPWTPAEYRSVLVSLVEADRRELLRHNHALDKTEIEELTSRLRQAIAANRELDERCARIVDGHGDIRPEHVLLGPRPLVIDRITFDRRIRLVDPAYDVALLAVECEFLSAAEFGNQITAMTLSEAADQVGPTTTALYRSVRATTRARLSVAHLVDTDRDADKWLDRTDAYVAIARRHLELADRRAGDGQESR